MYENDVRYDPQPMAESEYRPKRSQMLKDYEINLRFLSVGCVIRIGCKEIPFRDISEAMEELNNYVKNPHESHKKWNLIFEQED
jgi:hypothetical protein